MGKCLNFNPRCNRQNNQEKNLIWPVRGPTQPVENRVLWGLYCGFLLFLGCGFLEETLFIVTFVSFIVKSLSLFLPIDIGFNLNHINHFLFFVWFLFFRYFLSFILLHMTLNLGFCTAMFNLWVYINTLQ